MEEELQDVKISLLDVDLTELSGVVVYQHSNNIQTFLKALYKVRSLSTIYAERALCLEFHTPQMIASGWLFRSSQIDSKYSGVSPLSWPFFPDD